MTVVPGETIGPYRIVAQIGRGGMASVYKANQASLGRTVALKVLPEQLSGDPGFGERFRAEAMTVAALHHPNILQVFDYGEEAGRSYLVSELIDGGTLADRLGRPLSLAESIALLRPIASALDYAHGRGVVHRDVKPSNVLCAADGRPILSDFGLARMFEVSLPRITQTGTMLGTPQYMAPEQALGGDAGPAADRYALAIIAYEMLTGDVPFHADTPLATLLAHAQKPLPLPRERNAALTEVVESVLLKGLAKSPVDRYPTASAFVDALDAAATGAFGPRARRVPLRALAIGSVVTLLAAGLAAAATGVRPPSAAPASPAALTVVRVTPPPTPAPTVAPIPALTVSTSVPNSQIVAVPTANSVPGQANVAALTVYYTNNGPSRLTNVTVVLPRASGLNIAPNPPWIIGAVPPTSILSDSFLFSRPDLVPGATASVTAGLVLFTPGTVQLAVTVRATGAQAQREPFTITALASASPSR